MTKIGGNVETASGGGFSNKEQFTATANQTDFTLSVAPIGVLLAFWGGVLLPDGSYSYLGTNVTYNPTNNEGLNLEAGARINFIY